MPFLPHFFGWEGSPAKIDYRKKLPTYSNLSNLADLAHFGPPLELSTFDFRLGRQDRGERLRIPEVNEAGDKSA